MVTISDSATSTGERRLLEEMYVELLAATRGPANPKHNIAAQAWLQPHRAPRSFDRYFDIQNAQALWLELTNTILGIEFALMQSRTFKALEPACLPDFQDDIALSTVYYVHTRKMDLLNQAVYGLIKVQDLVNRLLHETLGGDLVATAKPDWEEITLRRKNVMKGLQCKFEAGALSKTDYDAINEAFAVPVNAPRIETVKAYRNRLTHHIRPSVDYPMFFSAVESRAGTEIRDTSGSVVARQYAIGATPPAEYRYEDLHDAFAEYLESVVDMLNRLSRIEAVHP